MENLVGTFQYQKGGNAPLFPQTGGNGPLFEEPHPPFGKKGGGKGGNYKKGGNDTNQQIPTIPTKGGGYDTNTRKVAGI